MTEIQLLLIHHAQKTHVRLNFHQVRIIHSCYLKVVVAMTMMILKDSHDPDDGHDNEMMIITIMTVLGVIIVRLLLQTANKLTTIGETGAS